MAKFVKKQIGTTRPVVVCFDEDNNMYACPYCSQCLKGFTKETHIYFFTEADLLSHIKTHASGVFKPRGYDNS